MKKNLWILRQSRCSIITFLLRILIGKEDNMLIYMYAGAVIKGKIKWSEIVRVFTPRIQEAIKSAILDALGDQSLVDELTKLEPAE